MHLRVLYLTTTDGGINDELLVAPIISRFLLQHHLFGVEWRSEALFSRQNAYEILGTSRRISLCQSDLASIEVNNSNTNHQPHTPPSY